jgi:pilus assembly protein Flp/PilA
MRFASKLLQRLLKDDAGVTAIEYGMIAALIAAAIIGALTALGGNTNSTYDNLASGLSSATSTGSSGGSTGNTGSSGPGNNGNGNGYGKGGNGNGNNGNGNGNGGPAG